MKNESHIYKRVSKIVFGLMSPKIIRKRACAKIVTAELYDREGYPVDGGLMDVRLGVIDPGLRCKTCAGKLKECTGHFGYIEFARPIIHIKYIPYVLNFLKSTCRECSKLLITDEKIKNLKKGSGGDSVRKSSSSIKVCPHCKAKQYNVKLEKPSVFMENDKKLSPVEVRARLEKIPDCDVEKLGINSGMARPEWMILILLPIPPVTMRPSITLESGERSEDDLTHKLGDIVRINQRLFENINSGAPEVIIEDLWELLQYHVTTYFDNTLAQIPPARHRSGQPLRSLTERIKSKEGRFRHNLAGKRVNFAARAVISPDPRINFNEVGVPKIVAMELTVPEKVTEWNLDWLKGLVNNGADQYPGVNYVFTSDGKKRKVNEETKEQIIEELEAGCVVERHLLDGDISVFNRQPSLHRMSIMAHKIKVLEGKSFRLNPGVCTPYNADFDGDEMNLHIPQTEEARAEAEILMQVQTQLISPKNGLNVMGSIHDAITGNYILTKHLTFSREEAVNILYSIGVDDIGCMKFNKGEVSGKDVFSALLPKNLDFIGASKDGEEVLIKKGRLIKGIIDKATIGEDNGTLIRSIYTKYGEDVGIDTVGRIFKLGLEVLLDFGFTTCLSDTDLPKEVLVKNDNLIKNVEKEVEELIERYNKGKLEAMPGLTVTETLEGEVLKLLNRLRDEIGHRVFDCATDDNSTLLMARSGAQGSFLNLAQMSALVGQQSLGGGRIRDGYTKRTLSLFKRGDLLPDSRGFIRSSYKKGLNPYEYFFHSMTGRDSLMDTALRTPKSGYLYRRLANALQDLKVEYDGTVRDSNKRVIQFIYGGDGIDVSKSEGGTIDVKRIVKEVMQKI
ncbi:MAG: DNA-directed RNA polymerase subunit A' [Nanoarchaeota archaeon]|nr:DNA-directed RNA polymerase subunit A' [Nanoarchaeota archaeon]